MIMPIQDKDLETETKKLKKNHPQEIHNVKVNWIENNRSEKK